MGNIIKGYPEVKLSITNPNVKREDALDRNTPLSFIHFIKNVEESYAPDTLQTFYTTYLNRWNDLAVTKDFDNTQLIIDRYKDFLKDITLNYSTNAEKKFISQIDFNDKNDLQVVGSFYSKKIRDIITYYSKKRDRLYFSTIKNKLKGTNFNLEQSAYELILNFLENREISEDYNIAAIKNNLSISLTEYFDNFAQYFNQEPDEQYYGKNYLQYSPDGPPTDNIFLTTDNILIKEVFAGLSDELKKLKEADQLFDNKRKQTEKFIATDYYYLSSNDKGEPLIDILFNAKNTGANFLNQDYPSTASVFSDEIISERDLGFFRPSNSGIASIESKRLKFFTRKKYDADQLYIFPDPNIYTNNDDILTFVIDTSRSINNQSKGIAVNQPNTDKNSTSFIGYNSEILQDRNVNTDLSFLFDEGYIEESGKDLFGNIFGLIKDNYYYRDSFTNETPDIVKNLVINGYQFFDDLYGEGYGFNYSATDSTTYGETIRSGLSTFTNGMTGRGPVPILAGAPGTPDSWTSFPTSAFNIFFRNYSPYQQILSAANFSEVDYDTERIINADVKEGAFFKFSDSQTLTDPVRSGLSSFTGSFEGGTEYYFTQLLDGGVALYDDKPGNQSGANKATIVRALKDTSHPTITGDFTLSPRLSGGQGNAGNGVEDFEGMFFTSNLTYDFTPGVESIDYNNQVDINTQTLSISSEKDNLSKRKDHVGKMYVKNTSISPLLSNVKELTKTLPYLSTKYNTSICDELSTVVSNFDIFYDTLFVETSSYLVIEKTLFKDDKFINPNTTSNSLSHSSNFYNKISNRFKVGNDVFYCRMVYDRGGQAGLSAQVYDLSSFRVYPEIYKYNYIKEKNTRIFPTAVNPVISSASYFDCLTSNIQYIECSKPFLTYSSENEQFNLGFLLKDQNKAPTLFSYLFEYKNNIAFLNTEYFIPSNDAYTNIFVSNIGTVENKNLSFSLSSIAGTTVPISANDNALVL